MISRGATWQCVVKQGCSLAGCGRAGVQLFSMRSVANWGGHIQVLLMYKLCDHVGIQSKDLLS